MPTWAKILIGVLGGAAATGLLGLLVRWWMARSRLPTDGTGALPSSPRVNPVVQPKQTGDDLRKLAMQQLLDQQHSGTVEAIQ